jgi:hypothetical protein
LDKIVGLGFSYKKQQWCEIFVKLGILAIFKGAAHRNIGIYYGVLQHKITVLS